MSAPRSGAVAVAGLVLVAASIDVAELLWFERTTAWSVLLAVSTAGFALFLLRRRSCPAAALAVAGLGFVGTSAWPGEEAASAPVLAQAGIWIVAFIVIAEGAARLRLTAIAVLGATVAVDTYRSLWEAGSLVFEPTAFLYGTALPGLVPLMLVALADAARTRIRLAAAQAEQAERLRESDARAAVHDERLRPARELHDAVANRLSAVAMRVTAVGHVHGDRHTPEGEALAEIGREVGTALGELRGALGTLRDGRADPATVAQPSLREIETLAGQARRAGATVEVVTSGEPIPLSHMLDLAAYRIVQEALMNVARHARPPCGTVRLDYGEDRLRIRVDDEGDPQGGPRVDPAVGHGLIGIRERAALCGGSATAGPRPDGGWRVEALLPLPTGATWNGIRAVARGAGFVSPGPTRRLIARAAGHGIGLVTLPDGLTPREREVLALVGHALSNAQIARRLRVEESTVKTHVQKLLAKLDVRTRVEAALIASRAGLVEMGSADPGS
ncbi:LuxR C-terminal-related transcriptional regulator [Streptomyces sp. ID05-04B]|uniref:helix-turn-helix transcriptional regulator n=1 Tax=Streptomyces sp. ID05-04B TaxID=3028661 RepID=UPI0029C4E0D4|nr:LuxR C-terminal-related transcriptional regulator [Streptomyces sp. ID05-04B]MDX5562700.1 LuxR C-terminal-related transcriptional regulator [Streptomyces sp. ID05-04B]